LPSVIPLFLHPHFATRSEFESGEIILEQNKGKVKVVPMFSLTEDYAMQTYCASGDIATLIL